MAKGTSEAVKHTGIQYITLAYVHRVMPRTKLLTLVLIYNRTHVLLGMKKRGFGVGRWNGFGGKVQEGESLENAARRELLEEANVTVSSLEEIGVLTFEFVGEPDLMEVHVFKSQQYEGQPQESEEMRPQWFDQNCIPYKEMWPDDILWYPLFLAGKKFKGYFKFEGHDTILDYTLAENS
jgi:8-oxo-dGTP diphosphatase/2-hydroxy-dATP diphosphatase